jgi:transposase
MTAYNNFIGIDIGKFTFVVGIHGQKSTKEFANTDSGIDLFFKEYKKKFPSSLYVLETTGGYEMKLLLEICKKKLDVHRANTRCVKSFIRSFGNKAKTDALDAKALSLYGAERSERLRLFEPSDESSSELYELTQRRKDLQQILVAEKNRQQAPTAKHVKESHEKMISTISEQVTLLDDRINSVINNNEALLEKKTTLKTIPGIGDITANSLIALLPELGTIDRRQIASLAGLAPKANDSGNKSGYRMTNKGRADIKPILFMAAMSARNSNSDLKKYYLDMLDRGKKKMVALTALMRKIIVIANAKIRDLNKNLIISET